MSINDDDITKEPAPAGEGVADGGANPGGHDGGADGSAVPADPASASSGTMPRVWPGTSVILAALVRRPKRWSSSCAKASG